MAPDRYNRTPSWTNQGRDRWRAGDKVYLEFSLKIYHLIKLLHLLMVKAGADW